MYYKDPSLRYSNTSPTSKIKDSDPIDLIGKLHQVDNLLALPANQAPVSFAQYF